MNYYHTHTSVNDGSPAMMVSYTDETITLVNEDGFQWTDSADNWDEIPDPTPREQWEVTEPADVYYTDEYYSGTGELIGDDSYIDYLNR